MIESPVLQELRTEWTREGAIEATRKDIARILVARFVSANSRPVRSSGPGRSERSGESFQITRSTRRYQMRGPCVSTHPRGKILLDWRPDARPGLTGGRLVVIIPIPIADGGDR